MTKLTKRVVDAAPPNGRDYFLWDEQVPGFGLRVFASGKRSYLVQYRAGGRTRRVTIGLHGPVTCEEARRRAMELLGEVARGGDPAEDRETNRNAMTVAQLCEAYLKAAERGLILGKGKRPKKPSTLATDRGRVTRHIVPLLGRRKVKDLTTPDVVRFMRDVAAGKTATDVKTGLRGRAIVEGGRGTATRTVGLLGGILSYAVTEGIIPANPARGVERYADGRREARLLPEHYRALGKGLELSTAKGEASAAIAAIRLLALTGCRRGEIEFLRWIEVDLKGRALRLEDTKEGKSVRPLARKAQDVLEGLPQRERFVLSGSRKDRPYTGLPKAWKRIMERALKATEEDGDEGAIRAARELQSFSPHVLRHSFASAAHDLGYSEPTIAAIVGHSGGGVTRRYIHAIDATLLAAANHVAATIAEWMGEPAGEVKGEVVPLRA